MTTVVPESTEPVKEAPKTEPQHHEPPFDEEAYMKMFDALEEKQTAMKQIVYDLHSQPDQDHRLAKVIDFVKAHEIFARHVCNLLVEMHNFITSK